MPTMEEDRADELRAMRDLELLAKVRAMPALQELVASLSRCATHTPDDAPEWREVTSAVVRLLSPDDAGRGDGGGT